MRPPDQAPHVHAASRRVAQHPRHRAAPLAGEPLVGVATPVDEQQQVTAGGPVDRALQLGEVGRSVDERADQVPRRPRLPVGVPVIEDRRWVSGLASGLLLAAAMLASLGGLNHITDFVSGVPVNVN